MYPREALMIKAIKFAMRYASLIDDIVDFINLCQESGKDGKLNNTEKGKLIKATHSLRRKIQNI